MHHNDGEPREEKCLADSARSMRACSETLAHCLEQGGKHAEPKHISILLDCIRICQLNQEFMLRDSMHRKCIADECAKICELCAESCENIDQGDAMMRECAKICRECAASCKDMPA